MGRKESNQTNKQTNKQIIRLSVRPWSVSENVHNSWTTWYIFITFCIHMDVNIP